MVLRVQWSAAYGIGLDDALRGLRDFSAEDEIEFRECSRKRVERCFVGEREEHAEIGLRFQRWQKSRDGIFRHVEAEAGAEIFRRNARIHHADDRNPPAALLNDDMRLRDRRAGGRIEQIRAEQRDG